ncbi:MAG: glycosyltransferase family 4 protein [Desulfuromonadales bacterium]|nr:glycosyltransferase family 4 protein [Desulfuromonadales bacterium]
MNSSEKNKLNILFISHDASRTGAPIMLLNLLRYFKKHHILSFNVLLNYTGPLESEFSTLAPTKFFRLKREVVRKLLKILKINFFVQEIKNKRLLKYYKNANFDLIYSNTIVNGDVLNVLSKLNIPIITHVHELDSSIDYYGHENWKNVKKCSKHFIAASHAVADSLERKRGVDRHLIDVVHSFISASPEHSSIKRRQENRRHLNISSRAFVVCGSGRCCVQKGTDLFVRLAKVVLEKKREGDIFFVWVGRRPTGEGLQAELDAFIDRNHLGKNVLWVGEVDNPFDYFSGADAFVSVSREDSFPLVCLEAASFGKPVLCFSGAGGMPEFVEDDAGYVVPYLDVELMAEKIVELVSNTKKLNQLGECARVKVHKYYKTCAGAAKIMEVIHRVVGGGGGL